MSRSQAVKLYLSVLIYNSNPELFDLSCVDFTYNALLKSSFKVGILNYFSII